MVCVAQKIEWNPFIAGWLPPAGAVDAAGRLFFMVQR